MLANINSGMSPEPSSPASKQSSVLVKFGAVSNASLILWQARAKQAVTREPTKQCLQNLTSSEWYFQFAECGKRINRGAENVLGRCFVADKRMKHRWIGGALTSLSLVAGNPDRTQAEWFALKWMEKPSAHGPSSKAGPEERIEFLPVFSFDKQKYDESGWRTIKSLLTEGDVIAYRKETWEAHREILLQGKLNRIPYNLHCYATPDR